MRIVAYYRVSTKGQGDSGLGLEAQEKAVRGYAEANGGTVVAAYKEVESGKRNDRPQLALALSHAKRSQAVLVVSKLDRLARNVAFLSAMMESKVRFVACDNPNANELTLHILSAVAQAEVKAISERTKVALQAAKARGVLLGGARVNPWKGREEEQRVWAKQGAKKAGATHKAKADEAYSDLYPLIVGMRESNHTLQAIADHLNALGHTTRRGKQWNPTQVLLVLRRAKALGNLN